MSKSILISIKPKWVAKILNGEKTIEIRKTCPNQLRGDTPVKPEPIDVYIYCTKGKSLIYTDGTDGKGDYVDYKYYESYKGDKNDIGSGKVVAKFTLNNVEEINRYCAGKGISYKTETLNDIELCDKSCLDIIEIDHYLYFKKGYAWHIDNLVIFDKPRELSEFEQCKEKKCPYSLPCHKTCHSLKSLTKAPQSWCYVEELL